jgi:hypothetical protein
MALTFMDVSSANVGELVTKNGKAVNTIYHDFVWSKAQAKKVDGVIMKAIQGSYLDPSFSTIAKSCTLNYKGAYAFLDYTKMHYSLGNEIVWGQKQAQVFLDTVKPYNLNLKVAIDYENNAYWETIENTNADRVIDRSLKILLAMCGEIVRLTGYWPIMYTNGALTKYMGNFTQCPLWIADPDEGEPNFSNWKGYALHQYTWTAPGKDYGNFTGNQYVDLSTVADASILLASSSTVVVQPDPVLTDAEKLNLVYEWYKQSHS